MKSRLMAAAAIGAAALAAVAGCGYIVLLLGLVCTTRWARATAAKLPT